MISDEKPADLTPQEQEIIFGQDTPTAEEKFNQETEKSMGTADYLEGVAGAQSIAAHRLRESFLAQHPEVNGLTEDAAEKLFLRFSGEAMRAMREGTTEIRSRAQAVGAIERIMRNPSHPYHSSRIGDPAFHEVERLFKLAHD